jgi:predicted nuclease of predicted toxin-antitoxin system
MARIALYLDEDVHPTLAKILRERGFDVLTTAKVGMLEKSDPEQLKFAAAQGRAILTYNVRDYVRLAQQYAEQRRSHAGIVVSDQLPLRELLRQTLRLLADLSAEEMVNQFEWLSNFDIIRMILVCLPSGGIIPDVIADAVQFVFMTDDMFVIIALPQPAGEGGPATVPNRVSVGGDRFKRLDNAPQ